MTTDRQANHAPSLPTSRKILCAVYGVIAVAALVATWSQNLAYFDHPAGFLFGLRERLQKSRRRRDRTDGRHFAVFLCCGNSDGDHEAGKHGV